VCTKERDAQKLIEQLLNTEQAKQAVTPTQSKKKQSMPPSVTPSTLSLSNPSKEKQSRPPSITPLSTDSDTNESSFYNLALPDPIDGMHYKGQ
jgi:hypothetical protein